jgi:hypothetical protein
MEHMKYMLQLFLVVYFQIYFIREQKSSSGTDCENAACRKAAVEFDMIFMELAI